MSSSIFLQNISGLPQPQYLIASFTNGTHLFEGIWYDPVEVAPWNSEIIYEIWTDFSDNLQHPALYRETWQTQNGLCRTRCGEPTEWFSAHLPTYCAYSHGPGATGRSKLNPWVVWMKIIKSHPNHWQLDNLMKFETIQHPFYTSVYRSSLEHSCQNFTSEWNKSSAVFSTTNCTNGGQLGWLQNCLWRSQRML